MKPPLEQNYYELLEVPRDATSAELDRAYDRAKAFYGVGSIAVYSLTAPEELKQVQDRIDEAYLILGDDHARAEYDARVGPPSPDERPLHREVREAREREAAKEAEARSKAREESKAKDEAKSHEEEKAKEESKPKEEPEAKAAVEGKAEATAVPESAAPAKSDDVPAATEKPAEAVDATKEQAVAAPAPRPRTPAPQVVAPPEPAPPTEKVEVAAKPASPTPSAPEAAAPTGSAESHPAEVAVPPPTPTPAPTVSPHLPAKAPAAAEVRLDLTVRPDEKRESRVNPGPQPPPPMEFPEPTPRGNPRRDSKPPERALPKASEIPADAVFNGEFLRKLRETLGLTVQELSDRTKIGKSHLENIEADRYGSLPPLVYLRGFLMSYARELRLDPVRVSKSYLEQHSKGGARPKG